MLYSLSWAGNYKTRQMYLTNTGHELFNISTCFLKGSKIKGTHYGRNNSQNEYFVSLPLCNRSRPTWELELSKKEDFYSIYSEQMQLIEYMFHHKLSDDVHTRFNLSNQLTGWLAGWLAGWPADWLNNWLTYWLNETCFKWMLRAWQNSCSIINSRWWSFVIQNCKQIILI